MSEPTNTLDESCHKMKLMNLNGQMESDPRYGRVCKSEAPISPFHQKQRSMGVAEGFSVEASPQKNPSAYKLYEHTQKEENDVYVKPNVNPVYENIDYYSSYRKAQPQVPMGSKLTGWDADGAPVYENVQNLSQRATPGPQVPYSQAPPPYPSQGIYSVMQAPKSSPDHSYKAYTRQQLEQINASDYVCMTGNISHTLSTNIPFQTTSARSYERTPATGIAGAPTKPVKEVKKSPEKVSVIGI